MTILGSDESEAAREEEQQQRRRRVNKVDCLIGRWEMNVVVIHSLKGHAVFLLTCGQPWLTCCHIVWCIYSWMHVKCTWKLECARTQRVDKGTKQKPLRGPQAGCHGDKGSATTRMLKGRYGRYTAGMAAANHNAVLWGSVKFCVKSHVGGFSASCGSFVVSSAFKVIGPMRFDTFFSNSTLIWRWNQLLRKTKQQMLLIVCASKLEACLTLQIIDVNSGAAKEGTVMRCQNKLFDAPTACSFVTTGF